MKPIADRAEVAIDLPEKLYIGSFTTHSNYDVKADAEQVALRLSHASGARRTVEFHLHYYLLADILQDLAAALAERDLVDENHRKRMEAAAQALAAALTRDGSGTRSGS